ncbi:MAG: hypothetical protein NT062_21010, partial [Proteobacteria bacterium]|nr:hypothetical protein [Pseudomonadota bacterium]
TTLRGRDELRDACLAAIQLRIPTISADDAARVFAIVERANLPIAIADRRAELEAERRQARAHAREAWGSEPRNAELEANLDSDDDFLVLADWLQAQRHPRGELIALQIRAASPDADAAVRAAAAAHLTAHADALLGPLAAYRLVRDGVEHAAFTWRRGYIERAHLSVIDDDPTLEELLECLLAHPSGRHLAELAIGLDGDDYGEPLDELIAMLARDTPASLRTLHLGAFDRYDRDISSYAIGALAPLWPRLARLTTLIVHGAEFTLGAIELPAVERVKLRTGGLSVDAARSIAAARWPRLAHLDVWYGDPNYGGECVAADVAPLLARTDLPALVHLGLKNAAFTDELCELLARAPLAAQLVELDLSMGTMSDAGARALVAAAPALPRLAHVDVSRNYLSDDGIAQLAAAFPTLIAADQGVADEDDRYPSVGE